MPVSIASDCLCDQHFGNQITRKASFCKKADGKKTSTLPGSTSHTHTHKAGGGWVGDLFHCIKDPDLCLRH